MARQSPFAAKVRDHVQNAMAERRFIATVYGVSGGRVAIIRPKQSSPDRYPDGTIVYYQAASGVTYAPNDRVLCDDVGGAVLVGHKY